jgi:hypothetical protein
MIWKTSEKRKESNRNTKTVEGHCSILEQVEDRISELKDKIEIKEKTEEILVKQLMSSERIVQEFSDLSKDQTSESWSLKKEKRGKP